jgi:SulP family sulfate permease
MGMMMVENIPFMHVICRAAMEAQGMGRATFATVFVTFAFSSIVVGVFFLVLGKLKLGSVVHFFPKHVIVGCIGGIGIFIFQTGLEVSTNQQWQWDVTVMSSFFTAKVIPLWLVSAGFEVVLRVISSMVNLSLLPPFYFVSIPVIFYIVVFGCGYDLDDVHKNGWFFEGAESVNPLLMWELMDFTKVDWSVFAYCLPTIIALTLFSLMHVPINIPSLTISTGHHSDMNNELVAHGISNIVSGATGGLQNYLCYSNSLLYFKCNGGGAFSGYCLSLVTLVFFFVGPSAVYMIPRCMAGCLLMHVGIDLTREGLWDSREGLDMFEYSSVVAIAVTMTFYGLTAGLVLGVICAAVTFTIQLGTHGNAIRGTMRAATLRSSRWRSVDASATLGKLLRHVLVVQLQGHLFFGNATTFAEKVENYLKDSSDLEDDIWFLILDFTLVLGIDSSAAETVAGIYDVCRKHNVRLCYSSPSENGFPCEVPLTERLLGLAKPEREAISERASIQSQTKTDKSPHSASKTSPVIPFPENVGRGSGGRGRNSEGEAVSGIELIARELGGRENGGTANGSGGGDGRSNGNCRDRMTSADSSSGVSIFEAFEQTVHIANSLDDALAWCEDLMLLEKTLDTDSLDVFRSQAMSDVPDHLKQLYALCPRDVDIKAVDKLVTYFERRQVDAGTRANY